MQNLHDYFLLPPPPRFGRGDEQDEWGHPWALCEISEYSHFTFLGPSLLGVGIEKRKEKKFFLVGSEP
jgi:hypothetical protein